MLDVASEASLNFPRQRLRSDLARMGTLISYGINPDYSALSLRCTRPNFDKSWQIFTDVILNPSFSKEDVALIQQRQVTSRRDDNDDPDSYLQRLQDRVAYAGHPYLVRTEGTAESLSRITPDDLRRYHQKMMETSRLLLVIVGDLNPAQVRDVVASTIGKLPRGNYHPEPMPQLAFDRSTVEVTPRALPTNYIQGLYTAPSPTSPDMDAMRIASSILRDRVFEEVRAKRNLSYAPDAFLRTQAANSGGIYVTAVDANQAVRVMLNEIARLQREPISAQEIQAVIAQYLTSYYLGQETNAAQAGDLAQYEILGGGWRNSVEVIERLKAVTPADVQRVSQKYMRNIRFVVLGNPQAVNADVFTGSAGD
jgi:predicted Zn-dependent peptidase